MFYSLLSLWLMLSTFNGNYWGIEYVTTKKEEKNCTSSISFTSLLGSSCWHHYIPFNPFKSIHFILEKLNLYSSIRKEMFVEGVSTPKNQQLTREFCGNAYTSKLGGYICVYLGRPMVSQINGTTDQWEAANKWLLRQTLMCGVFWSAWHTTSKIQSSQLRTQHCNIFKSNLITTCSKGFSFSVAKHALWIWM